MTFGAKLTQMIYYQVLQIQNKNMFDVDRSAARGLMSAQKLIVFKHDSILGNAPANKLFDLVKVNKICNGVPRCFADYKLTIERDNCPAGVTVVEMI